MTMHEREPRGIAATLIRAFGNAMQAGIDGVAAKNATPRKRRGLKGCQPCEAQKNVDKVMRTVRGQ